MRYLHPNIWRLREPGLPPVLVEVLPSPSSTLHPVRFENGVVRQMDRRYLDAHLGLPTRHGFPCRCVDCWQLRWLLEHVFPDTFRNENHRAFLEGYEMGAHGHLDRAYGLDYACVNPYWFHGYRARTSH